MGGPDRGDARLDGRRGWLVVAVLAACVVGFPVAILVWPPTFLPYTDAFLALSMVPALVLGAAGVLVGLRTADRPRG
jgi:hypothetical protein